MTTRMTMPASRSETVTPTWWVIARQEIAELWLSSKGLGVLFGFTMLLAVLSYLASADAGINLLDARESVGVVVQTAIGLGTLAALVVSADAISGERERGTLEALLVTPVRRGSIVLGKLLAATTMWVASLVVALPFVIVMAHGPGVAADAVAVLGVAGSLVAAALTALGLAVSALAMSNRVSLAVSLTLLLFLAAPGQLPAIQANGPLGIVLVRANPVSAGLQLANNVLVKQQAWADQWPFLISPVGAAVVLSALAVALSSRLELGGSR
ncbi:MAG: ABC transporter permease subunit [Sporichthyaceae bacterium]